MTREEYEKKLKQAKEKIDKEFERTMKSNDEFREFFEKHPEKIEAYKQKMLDSGPLW